jgi:hypothetical protein
VRADEKLTAFVELESAIRACHQSERKISRSQPLMVNAEYGIL